MPEAILKRKTSNKVDIDRQITNNEVRYLSKVIKRFLVLVFVKGLRLTIKIHQGYIKVIQTWCNFLHLSIPIFIPVVRAKILEISSILHSKMIPSKVRNSKKDQRINWSRCLKPQDQVHRRILQVAHKMGNSTQVSEAYLVIGEKVNYRILK